jgi:hypothetical protein
LRGETPAFQELSLAGGLLSKKTSFFLLAVCRFTRQVHLQDALIILILAYSWAKLGPSPSSKNVDESLMLAASTA